MLTLPLKTFPLVLCSAVALVTTTAPSMAVPSWAESLGVDTYDVNGKPNDQPFYGSGHDFPVAMTKMPDGGFVVAGQLDLPELHLHTNQPGPTGALVRFAADGTILWQTELLQTNNRNDGTLYYPAVSHVHAIVADAGGNIYLAGGKGNTFNGGEQPFVAKFSMDGALLWESGFSAGSAVVGTPPHTEPLGVGTINYLCLTSDGGIAVTLSQTRPAQPYSIPVLAKFNADGSLAFNKAYENAIQYLGSTPVCQSQDGSRYVMAFVYAQDGSAPGDRYGLYLLVTDASGNIIAQRGYNHSDAPGETPVAIVATSDGGFATLSSAPDYAGGILRKFNSDLSAETLHLRVTGAPGHNQHVATNSLVPTSDNGFLIGGETVNDFSVSQYDVMLMKVNSSGLLQFVSILGGPKNEGGPSSINPNSSFAIETSDGGYGLAATSASYHVGHAISGGFYDIPDWWMAKTDSNRKVRNFPGAMLDQSLDNYSASGLTESGTSLSSFNAPSYPYALTVSSQPDLVLQDLSAKALPDQPTITIQASSPRILSSRVAEAVVGQHFAYHTLIAFFPNTDAVTYSASGLPAGFVINQTTGVISGVPPAGSETIHPLVVTLSASDGTDTATLALQLSIGDGVPQFSVNGSDQPSYPNPSATPVAGLADKVLSFAAIQPGALVGRIINVEASTNPSDSSSWQRLSNGTNGYMTYDTADSQYVLNSTSYPQLPNVYFRARLQAYGHADLISNVVGPFDLGSNAPRAGQPVFKIVRNGVRADFDFRATELAPPNGVTLRVQSSTSPSSEGSWSDVGDATNGHMNADGEDRYSHTANNLPLANGLYFRAIASFSGGVDSLSNIIGPYNLVADQPAQVALISPAGSVRGSGSESDPLVYSTDTNGQVNLHLSGSVTFPQGSSRSIKMLSLLVDGSKVAGAGTGASNVSLDYVTSRIGRRVIELLAVDDLGFSARAGTGPLYIEVEPSGASAKGILNKTGEPRAAGQGYSYNLITDNADWDDASAWQDFYGHHGVPGPRDSAAVGSLHLRFSRDVEVGSLTFIGTTHVVGPAIITVDQKLTFESSSSAVAENYVQLIIQAGGECEMRNSADVTWDGTITNHGTWRVRGRGGIKGLSNFTNSNLVDFHLPLLSGSAVTAGLPASGRALSSASVLNSGKIQINPINGIISPNGGGIIGNDGASAVAANAANLITPNGGTIVAAAAGSLITNDGGSLITNDGGSIIGNDGASFRQQGNRIIGNDGASLITNDGGSLITNDGGSIVAQAGGNIVAQGAGNRPANATPAGTSTAAGYRQIGGETDMSRIAIAGTFSLENGVVTGSGLIGGDLTVSGGVLAPGHSPGFLAVTGAYSQSGGTMVIEAAGGEAGQFDRVQVGGAAQLGGALLLTTSNGYVPLPDDQFVPLGYSSVSGAFNSVSSNAQVSVTPTGLVSVLDPSATPAPTPSPTPIASPSPTASPTVSPTPTASPSPTATASPSATPSPSASPIITPTPTPSSGQALNISTRLRVGTGDNVLIGGFIVRGSSSKRVVIRALGPSLTAQGVAGALLDPTLELHKPDGTTVFNDDWKSNQAELEATHLAPTNDAESAIVQTLAPGAYTAIVRGKGNATGVALVEVYDPDAANSRVINISTRGLVQTGDNVMIGGFIIGAGQPARVVVRAVGPSLIPLGVTNALLNPSLELHNADGTVLTNNDWRETQETAIAASGLAPTDDREAAIIATMPPGAYTAIVRGEAGTTGVALVEAYFIE